MKIPVFLCMMVMQLSLFAAERTLMWSKENQFEGWNIKETKRAECKFDGTNLIFSNIENDSYIFSGELNIDPSSYNQIEIEYKASGIQSSTKGQLYYENEKTAQFNDNQKWVIPSLTGDGLWHVIKLTEAQLVDTKDWKTGGITKRLRLDMMDQSGGIIEIKSIKIFYARQDIKSKITSSLSDGPAWPQVKSEVWDAKEVIKSNLPYFHGKMIKNPEDVTPKPKDGASVFYMRRKFIVPENIERTWVQFTADDSADLFINNKHVKSIKGLNCWKSPVNLEVTEYMIPGKENILAICYQNLEHAGGVLMEMFMKKKDKSSVLLESDAEFKTSSKYYENWKTLDFDASKWTDVVLQEAPPAAPWIFQLPYIDYTTCNVLLNCKYENKTYDAGEIFSTNFLFEGTPPSTPFQYTLEIQNADNKKLYDEVITVTQSDIKKLSDNQWNMTLRYKLPLWLISGKMTLSAVFPFIVDRLKPMNITYQSRKLSDSPLTATVKKTPSGPQLYIDGKIFFPVIGNRVDHHVKTVADGFEKIPVNMVTVHTTDYHIPWWFGPDQYDTREIDCQVNYALAKNPDAKLIMWVSLYTPKWWGNKNKEELAKFQDQSYESTRYYSQSSLLARRDMEKALTVFIKHCENAPYRDRIAGYLLASGETIEWLGWYFNRSAPQNRMMDYSAPNQKKFKEFISKNYPELDSKNDIPSMTQRLENTGNQTLLYSKNNLPVIAYNEFHSLTNTEMMIYQCQVAKKLLNNKKIIGVYYGYPFELSGMPWAPQLGAHFNLKEVLDSNTVDFILSPQSYGLRILGGIGADMKPFTSINNHNILSIVDDDTRTHNTPPKGFFQAVNKEQSISIIRRNFGSYLCRLQPLCALALEHGTEFNFPEAQKDISSLGKTGKFCIENGVKRKAEIAVVVSEKSMKYLPFEKELSKVEKGWAYKHDGTVIPVQRSSLRLTGELIYWQRLVLARVGAPVDYLLAEDLKDAAGDYKLWIFLNSFEYDDALLAFVTKLRQKNTTIMWMYAPGYFYNHTASIENMRKLTGFQMEKSDTPLIPAVKLTSGEIMGLTNEKLYPMFYVGDSDSVTVMGKYIDTSLTGLAMKKIANSESIFCGPNQLRPEFLKQLAINSGVHIFSNSLDPMDANDALVSIHARTSGKKEIILPRKTDVVDVFQQKIVARNVDKFTFDAPLHSSWLFYYGDADKFLEGVK